MAEEMKSAKKMVPQQEVCPPQSVTLDYSSARKAKGSQRSGEILKPYPSSMC